MDEIANTVDVGHVILVVAINNHTFVLTLESKNKQELNLLDVLYDTR